METTVWAGGTQGILSTDRAESSHGIPVLLIDEQVLTPACGYNLVREHSLPRAASDPLVIAWNRAVEFYNPAEAVAAREHALAILGDADDVANKLAEYGIAQR